MREGFGYRTRRTSGGDEWLMIVTVAGSGVHRYGRSEELLPPGAAILYEPGISQDYGASREGWELAWTHFLGDGRLDRWLDWPRIPGGAGLLSLGQYAEDVLESLNELIAWQAGSAADRHEFATNALERTLLWCNRANPSSAHAGREPRVDAALAHIMANIAHNLSAGSVAEAVGLSRSRLAHIFRSEIGLSIPAYIEARRMERAEDLLRMTNRHVGEISRLVGYSDPLYFSRRFRERTGLSPRAWRAQLSAEEDHDTPPGA
jgi:AraC family transcriptional regulator of arabinose operon